MCVHSTHERNHGKCVSFPSYTCLSYGLCCCDKTPWVCQLIEGRVYLGPKVPEGWESMPITAGKPEASRHDGQNSWEFTSQAINSKQEGDSKRCESLETTEPVLSGISSIKTTSPDPPHNSHQLETKYSKTRDLWGTSQSNNPPFLSPASLSTPSSPSRPPSAFMSYMCTLKDLNSTYEKKCVISASLAYFA